MKHYLKDLILSKTIVYMNNKYKLIAFDLDDTLSPAKNKTDKEMADLIKQLLEKYKVAIITWWMFKEINNQIIEELDNNSNFSNFYPFPTTWTRMYYYDSWEWKIKYAEDLTVNEIDKITLVLNKAIVDLDLQPIQVWWEIVENRWSQITYSALWQKCPLEIKKSWDQDFKKRLEIKRYIEKDLEEFNIWLWGSTSIDITRKWVDKAYWIKKVLENLDLEKEDILFMWDAIFEWWNDFPITKTGIDYYKVKDYNHTKELIKELLK